MKITNELGLPEALIRAVDNEMHSKEGEISVTQLIAPTQQTILFERYFDKIEADVVDLLWTILGSAVHALLEKVCGENAVCEQRVEWQPPGTSTKVVGTFDLLEDGVLQDYKVTSAWAIADGVKQDWEKQLRTYDFLATRNGFTVRELKIHCLLRDWSKLEARRNKRYIQAPYAVFSVPRVAHNATEFWLIEQVALYDEYRDSPDELLPPCTDIERWHKPDRYAVIKDGSKRAYRVVRTLSQAEQLVAKMAVKGQPYYIQFRPGEDTRCENYCPVKNFCRQYQRIRRQRDD